MKKNTPAPTLKLIRLPQVEEKVGLSKPTIYRKMTQNTFPRPRNTGQRAVAWVESEIDAWILSLEMASFKVEV